MPVLDGFGVIRKIRGDPAQAKLPVLAATAYAMRGDREKVLESGFDGYISKPINPAALEAEIDRLIGARVAQKSPAADSAAASSGS